MKRQRFLNMPISRIVGLDLYALEDITVGPLVRQNLVATGIKVALPPGYELQVRPKSGRALKTKLRVANTPGTIRCRL